MMPIDARPFLAALTFLSGAVGTWALPSPTDPVTSAAGARSTTGHADAEFRRRTTPAGSSDAPRTIASTILDTDELLLSLLTADEAHEHVRCTSKFARDPNLSNVQAQAAAVGQVYTRGRAELPIVLRTDVVFTSPFSDPHATSLWRSVGLPVVALEPATSLEATLSNVRLAAKHLGMTQRGETLAGWMTENIARLRAATASQTVTMLRPLCLET